MLALVLVVFLSGVIAFAPHWGSRQHSNGLTTTTSSGATAPYPSKNLPPSRDNDAGRARSLDATPDNDTDAWQRG